MSDEMITNLEMTSPSQLVPGRSPEGRLEIREVGRAEVPVVRSIDVRIGEPLGWTGRTSWTDAEWEEELARPGFHAWIAQADGEVVGLVELEAEPDGDVEIVVFGLVPECIGQGLGAELLTIATRLGWEITSPQGNATRRVWVQTSSRDHPNALSNYEHRGFRAFSNRKRDLGPAPDPQPPNLRRSATHTSHTRRSNSSGGRTWVK
jgi:ribosomal protein S18 acetylase RimI-like enzyme